MKGAPVLPGIELKQRLANLTATQRARLIRELAGATSGKSPASIVAAKPLRVEAAPTESDAGRTVAVYPAGPGQMQMWFLQRYTPESPAYNSAMAFHLRGPLNVSWLEAAFRSLVQRHDTLRTTFAMEDTALVQRVASSFAFQLEHENLEEIPVEARSEAASRSVQELARAPFDLAAEPQIRARLVRLHADEHLVVVVLHHIISDGSSRSNLFRDLSAFYAAEAANVEVALPALPLQFVDYSAWRRNRLQGAMLAEQIDFWEAKLAGKLEPLDLPTHRSRRDGLSSRGAQCSLRLDPELWRALQARAQAEGATLFMVLLAAYKVLLHRYTGRTDVRVGVPVANRLRAESEGLIGFFVNTLVMRTALSGELSLREVIGSVRTTASKAFAHSELPFERMIEMVKDRTTADRAPLIQVLFALQDFPETRLDLPGVEVTPHPVSTGTSKVDFGLAVERSGDGWVAKAEYSTDLFDAAQAEQLLADWCRILKIATAEPDRRVSDIALPGATPSRTLAVKPPRTGSGFSCYLIGQGSLPIQCGESLLARGFKLLGVIAKEGDPVRRWARERNIPLAPLGADMVEWFGAEPFDYLFSINNVVVLPDAVLKLPALGAINYHDALLPRYAGLHATSWAILNQEQRHGITWHRMVREMDGGEILKQRVLHVGPHETALSLNQRCLEAAAEAFEELLIEIANGAVVAVAQDLTQRTYFSKYQRPPASGVIFWEKPADEIEALVRALDFGPFQNPLGLPKIALGHTVLAATKANRISSEFDARPGTVVAMAADSLTVTTATQAIELTGLMTLEGEPPSAADCEVRFGLHVSRHLPDLEPATADCISQANASACRHEAFWVRRLESLRSTTLPVTHQATCDVRSGRLARLTWTVPAELKAWLGRHDGAWTQGEFLLAAFSAYLARIGGEETFDVGFAIEKSGQPMELAGLFVRRVPLRLTIDPTQAIGKVLPIICAELKEIRRRGTFARDILPRHPQLRQIAELREGYKPRVSVQLIERVSEIEEPADGEFLLLVPEEGSEGGAVFAQDQNDESSIGRMMQQFSLFLKNLAATDGQVIACADLLPEAERHTVLVEWNQTAAKYDSDRCIHALFEAQVARTPETLAVMFKERSLTYRQLNQRANRLAHALRNLGVGPDTFVALFVDRSLEMVIGLLAILKAGGAYLPLDPHHPRERLAFMLDDAQPKVLLTLAHLAQLLPANAIPAIRIDEFPEPDQPEFSDDSACEVTPQNLAYIIYTSGSTGRPKGVLIEHHALVNYTLAALQQFGLGAGDRVLQFASLSFDASAEEIFPCLTSGATLVLRTEDMIEQTATFLARCAAWRLTVLDLPTAYWNHLTIEMETGGWELPPAIRLIIIGGERASPEMLARWRQKFGRRVPLLNTYGPTETTVVATWCDLAAPSCDASPRSELAIGRPIPNTAAYVLDSHLQPVPIGVTGELFISGHGLARGYLNQPEMTAERFIPNPFASGAYGRLYRTGDRVRYRPDGLLEFHGRVDQQVKIRGHRIEVGEVESVLAEHPAVRAVAVVVRQSEMGEQDLAGFIIARETDQLSIGSLREWLASKLPDYMVPARFVQLQALPLTPNGKLDRKALERLDGEEMAAADYVAPRNEAERKLAEIWQQALRRDCVGIHDDFFDLGGHSLLAVVINSRIAHFFGVEVPLRWVFEHPTIEQLASLLEPLQHRPSDAWLIKKANRLEPLPMSFGQQGMWLLQQMLPDPATYNVPFECRLSGPVDPGKIRASLQVIVERHEVLRTALIQEGGELLQKVYPPEAIPLPWREMDLAKVPPDQRQSVLGKQLLDEVRRLFDLGKAPLWRVLWLKLGTDEHILVFTFHHAIMDAWSLRLFFQEWSQIFVAPGQAEEAGLPDVSMQYADYAGWQRRWFTGKRLEEQRNFWKAHLEDLPPVLELPMDKARPVRLSGRGAVHRFRITGRVVTRLRDFAREENSTLFSVLLAAFHVWLHRYTGQTDVVVGTPVANRKRAEVQSLIGYFLNTLPIRVRLDGDPTFREVLRQVRKFLLGAFAHSELPFEQMVEMAVKEREAGQHPLFQVMFVYLEQTPLVWRLDQAEMQVFPIETGTSKNDLTLSIRAADETLECRLEYAADLFSAETAERMASHLAELFQAMTDGFDNAISELNLIPENERQQILVDWNQTQRDFPHDKCIHHLFEEQVERTPDAVAVVFEENSLTYRELNARANCLAHHLRSLGVGPDVVVGLCVERSIEMVVALLGILKAGGAYAPLDSSLPQQRLSFLVRDAGCAVVVTQEASLALLDQEQQAGKKSPAWVLLDTMTWESTVDVERNPEHVTAPDHLAYVLYTSGSTGQPKGVEMPHRPLVNMVHSQCAASAMRLGSRTLQFASLGFDVSFQEFFSTWSSGGTLVLLPDEIRRDPTALLNAIGHHKIERTFLPFVVLERIAEVAEKEETLPVDLREVMVAGEQLYIGPAIRRFFHRMPGCRLWNHYGPTECHVVTTHEMAGPALGWPEKAPIGRPLANCHVYVLDASGKPVPLGAFGELYIGGVCLSRGYRHSPELTKQRYIWWPFGRNAGERLYRTGDICRWRSNGELEYSGRVDEQVKIRGHRVELGEIETALGELEGVCEAVATLREAANEKRLVAYIVTDAGRAQGEQEFKIALKARLPEYMIPAQIEFLSTLPLTPNGKVDRRALPEPKESPAAGNGHALLPRNLLEMELARLWQRLLQRKNIGRHDNFFALGGHSLLAARLAAEIDNLLGCKLPIAALFQSPTIESLAQRLTDENWTPLWSSLVPLQPLGSKPPIFFTHGWGGDAYVLQGLAQLLVPDQPSYGLQAVGLGGEAARHTTVEEMASHYVKEIRSFQPEGPYYLAGYSMGGLIAFEMAQQLFRLGQQVALLALLDTSPRSVPWPIYARTLAPFLCQRLQFHLQRWLKIPPADRFSYFRKCWSSLHGWIVRNRRAGPVVTAPPENTTQAPQVPGFQDYYWAVASAYRLRQYPGSIDVFLSETADRKFVTVWRHLARGGAILHRVPGTHFGIMGLGGPDRRPELAAALETALARAQAARPSTRVENSH